MYVYELLTYFSRNNLIIKVLKVEAYLTEEWMINFVTVIGQIKVAPHV